MRGDMLDIAIIDDDIEAIKAIKKILANIKIVDFVESYVSFNDFLKLRTVATTMMLYCWIFSLTNIRTVLIMQVSCLQYFHSLR